MSTLNELRRLQTARIAKQRERPLATPIPDALARFLTPESLKNPLVMDALELVLAAMDPVNRDILNLKIKEIQDAG